MRRDNVYRASWAVPMALLLHAVSALVVLLQRLQTRREKRCRVQKRGRRPSLRELLLDPDQGGFLTEQQPQEEIDLRAA
jgi:hypothetical protein